VLRARARSLLALDTLRWVEVRGERVREVDLRAQLLDLTVGAHPDATCVEMSLVLEQERAGRPASILAALGVEVQPLTLVRTDIEVARPQLALRAWRTVGRFR
jgi:hypothetical protein